MFARFINLSIKKKIIFFLFILTAFALFVSSFLFIIYDKQQFKRKALRDLSILAETVGNNNAANLEFFMSGKEDAKKSLQLLASDDYIEMAAIYNTSNLSFADYAKQRIGYRAPEKLEYSSDTIIFSKDKIIITKPIIYKNHTHGTIFIQTNLDEYKERTIKFLVVISLIILLALIISLIMAIYFQGLITKPIVNLADLMKNIADTRNYSIQSSYNSKDEIGQLSSVFNEMITRLGKQNKDLKIAKDRAEYSLKIKEQFLANMSHEIRTPMNGVIGMTDLLAETELNEEQFQYLENIKISADNLLVIINDILDFSKIEAGKVKIVNEAFDFRKLVHQYRDIFEKRMTQKGLFFTIEIDDAIPNFVVGDKVRLNQILTNLVGNAFKFTQKGGISMKFRLKTVTENSQTIEFEVIDTGIGIMKDKLEAIFEEFNQATNLTTREYGGTGLGLTISKQLVHLMEGTISVESKFGEGSNFLVTLPFGITNIQSIAVNQVITPKFNKIAQDKPLNVLLAEDNKLNQLFAREVLQKNNMKVTLVENGNEAVKAAADNLFDVILMDLHMPELDGYQATKQIRTQLEQPNSLVPIIALTAAVTKSEIDKSFEAGINDYIAKPFKAEILIKKILQQTINKEFMNESKKITNLDYLKNMAGDNNEIIAEMIEMFIDQIAEYVTNINKAIKEGNWDDLKLHVHSAKSSVAIMGMNKLRADMQLFENAVKARERKEEYPEMFANFISQTNKGVGELKEILLRLKENKKGEVSF